MEAINADLVTSAVAKYVVHIGISHGPDLQLTSYDERVHFSIVIVMLTLSSQSSELAARLADLGSRCGGELGVFAQIIGTADSAGLNETHRFPRQSVYKLPIAMAILEQVDRKRLTLREKVRLSTGDAQRIKGLLPSGTSVAHKTGTNATRNGKTAATNDIGIVTPPGGRHLAIAVFVKDSSAAVAAREGAIAQAASAASDRWAVRQ